MAAARTYGWCFVSLDTLTAGTYALNMHMSDADLATYTSCGNIEG